MADIREKLGRACVTSDMGDSASSSEVDNDRVGALGRAAAETPLGAAIVRWIGSMEMASYGVVVNLLAGRIEERFHIADEIACKLAMQACREFGDWACLECAGRGEVVSGVGLRFICPTCNGTKMRRYGDPQRADALGFALAEYQAQAPRLAWALSLLREHDHLARQEATAQLDEAVAQPAPQKRRKKA